MVHHFKRNLLITLVLAVTSAPSFPFEKNDAFKFIGDQVFKTGSKFKKTEIGGLSGLFYEANSQILYAISDDRSRYGKSRFYTFQITLTDKKFSVSPEDVHILKSNTRQPYGYLEIDPEGITISKDKRVLISLEGDHKYKFPPTGPRFFETDIYGKWQRDFAAPDFLTPNKDQPKTFGAEHNRGFEALTLTKDGKYLFTGTESALAQDDTRASLKKGSLSRIYQFKAKGKDFQFDKAYVYPVERVPHSKNANKGKAENGLVEIYALDKNTLITMERAVAHKHMKTTIRLFLVDLSDASDVGKMPTLKGEKFIPVKKTLLFDLDQVKDKLSPGNRELDNIEGFTFGPVLKNGSQSIIMVSDNNFNTAQKTLFIALQWDRSKQKK